MQVDTSTRFAPQYLEKITLYFHPDGYVLLRQGNTFRRGTPEEVLAVVRNRLAMHVTDAVALQNGHKEGHNE